MLHDTNGQTLAAEESLNHGIPAAEIRSSLERVLTSRAFIHSHRIRAFLQFVVEECLAGQHQRLKEYLIGLEVFNRSDIFDPRVDSIVRVEARRLRAKLEEYYLTEGRDEELRIVLRKGSYVPHFEYRRNNALGLSYGASHSLRRSLAIAPFTVRNGGQESIALIDEITRRLSHVLIREGHFQVVRTMAAEGHSLKPDYIVEGSIDLQGDQMRFLLQLLNVSDTSHVWSERVECSVQNLAPIDELGRALTREMLLPLGEAVRAKLHGEHRHAYDYYLQGRFDWRRGTPDSIRGSVSLFQQAVEADPSYGAAWAALAEALAACSLLGLVDIREGAAMKSAAQRACELNPDLSEAHSALGAALSLFDSDWRAGEKEFQRAIQLDPTHSTAHVIYGAQLGCRGMHQAAIAEVERALELNPASLLPNFVLGWLYGVAGRLEEAMSQHCQIAKLAPDFTFCSAGIGWVYAAKGMFTEAIAHLERAQPLFRGTLGFCYAKAGRTEDALRLLSQMEGNAAVGQASVYAGLGDVERALTLLEQAKVAHDPRLPLHLWGPEFADLRNDPRLRALQPV